MYKSIFNLSLYLYKIKINSTKISCIRVYLTFVYTFVRYNVVCLYYNLKRYNMELRIKDVLKEKKVTVVSLAGMIGITQPNMSNIVNGKSAPSLETLERIANALEVDITELFDSRNTRKDCQCFRG